MNHYAEEFHWDNGYAAALKDYADEIAAHQKWTEWLVKATGFPYNMTLDEHPPCSPIELAEAYIRIEDTPSISVDDLLGTMETELGADYLHKWFMATGKEYHAYFKEFPTNA